MKKDIYLGMRPGDLDDKPYARYWNPDMQPLQPQVAQAVVHGREARGLGFPMDQADQLLDSGHLALENGFTRLGNGQLFVAVQTLMPNVHGAMFEWWMGWHYMEAQRYKLWHPRAHIANGTREMLGDDPQLSDKEKYLTTHYVTEYIGDALHKIRISFAEPATVFGNLDSMDSDISALVCGKVQLQGAPITIGYLIHQLRQIEGGAEMRSRFWLGTPHLSSLSPDNPINKALGSRWILQRLLPASMAEDMLVHCGMEMNHLAGFLPALYDDYH